MNPFDRPFPLHPEGIFIRPAPDPPKMPGGCLTSERKKAGVPGPLLGGPRGHAAVCPPVRDSWRSVPITCRPPADPHPFLSSGTTPSFRSRTRVSAAQALDLGPVVVGLPPAWAMIGSSVSKQSRGPDAPGLTSLAKAPPGIVRCVVRAQG